MYTYLPLFQYQIRQNISEKRQGRHHFFEIPLGIGNKPSQPFSPESPYDFRSPFLLAYPEIEGTALIEDNESVLADILHVRQGPDFLDRIERSRSSDQQYIDIGILSFQCKIHFFPI